MRGAQAVVDDDPALDLQPGVAQRGRRAGGCRPRRRRGRSRARCRPRSAAPPRGRRRRRARPPSRARAARRTPSASIAGAASPPRRASSWRSISRSTRCTTVVGHAEPRERVGGLQARAGRRRSTAACASPPGARDDRLAVRGVAEHLDAGRSIPAQRRHQRVRAGAQHGALEVQLGRRRRARRVPASGSSAATRCAERAPRRRGPRTSVRAQAQVLDVRPRRQQVAEPHAVVGRAAPRRRASAGRPRRARGPPRRPPGPRSRRR